MKKLTKKSLIEASKLSDRRALWLNLEDLRSNREWSGQKTEFKVVPPLPFERKHRTFVSILTANLP